MRGKTFYDPHAAICAQMSQERDNEINKGFKLDIQAKNDYEFFDVVDARNTVTNTVIAYDALNEKIQQL